MIRLSTNKIYLKSSPEELFKFLGQTEKMAQILSSKKTKHLKVEGETITFILKWAARFNFSITEKTPEYILIESTEGVEFGTALRFDISKDESGTFGLIHIETDTAPVIDFTLEAKIKKWVAAIVENLEQKFG